MSARQFLASADADGWRVLWGGGYASTLYRTGSFSVGLALVDAIGKLAGADGGQLDVHLRPDVVTVRLSSHGFHGLSERDLHLAGQIAGVARELGVPADPTAVHHVQIAIDALVTADVLPFWRAVLGYEQHGEEDLVDPTGRGPSFWFQAMDAPRPQRNRFHVDLYVPHDQVEARIAGALAAGGRIVNDTHAPDWWTLADAEGNEVDLAIWLID